VQAHADHGCRRLSYDYERNAIDGDEYMTIKLSAASIDSLDSRSAVDVVADEQRLYEVAVYVAQRSPSKDGL